MGGWQSFLLLRIVQEISTNACKAKRVAKPPFATKRTGQVMVELNQRMNVGFVSTESEDA